ncbi:MAG: tetratricopeptide repeat protein [Anaerolineaceae bacterium]
MNSTEEKIFQEALSAIEEQDNLRAKDLLTRLLKMDQQNPQYWLWMSAVVNSEKERRFCLQQVLKFDPQNTDARRGLILLGDLPLDDNLRVPLINQQRKWSVPEIEGLETENTRIPWVKVGLAIAAIAIVITLIVMAVTSNRLWIFKNRQVAVIGTAQSTPTFPATKTATITPTPKFEGPTPPWMDLAQTYTPTPIYVNTPHPIIEAYRIAVRNYERNDWTQAVTYFQQAIQADSTAPDLPYLLGEVYRLNGQNNLALEAYNLSLSTDENFGPAYLGKAKIHISLEPETYEEVINELEKAISLDPSLGEAYIELANIQIKNNELEKAQLNLEKASQLLPESPLISLALGKISIQKKDYESALMFAIRANEQDRTNLESYRFLGQAYQALGMFTESLDPLIVFATHSKSKDPLTLAWLADAYAANNMMDKAIELYDEAISEDKFAVDVYLKRGQMYLNLEEFQAAYNDFEMAYKIRPISYEACMLMGETLLKMEAPGDAYQQISKCQKLSENDEQLARMFFYRAISLEALDNEVAIQEWERLIAIPENSINPVFLATAQYFISSHYTPTPTNTKSSILTKTMTPEITAPSNRIITPSPTITKTSEPN